MDETQIQPGITTFSALGISLPKQPILAAWVTVVDLEEGRIQFRGANFSYTLHHPVFCGAFRKIQHFLDGTHPISNIVDASGEFLPTTIEVLLKTLRANCVLHEANSLKTGNNNDLAITFLEHYLPTSLENTASTLHTAVVAVVGENILASAVVNALKGWGIIAQHVRGEFTSIFPGKDLVIVCGNCYQSSLFYAANAAALASGCRWMRVMTEGTLSVLGPTFVPWQSACYVCLEKRYLAHVSSMEDEDAFQAALMARSIDIDTELPEPMINKLSCEAATEVVRIITGFAPPATIGRFYELLPTQPRILSHDVLRLPRCQSCRSGAPHHSPWDLESLIQLEDKV